MEKTYGLMLLALILSTSVYTFSYSVILPTQYYEYMKICASQYTALIYAVGSNCSVRVMVLNQQNFEYFSSGLSYSSLVTQCGNEVVNGILLNPGVYYLVIYSPKGYSNVTYSYCEIPVKLTNCSTHVSEYIILQPLYYERIPVHLSTLGSPSTLSLQGISNETVCYKILNCDGQDVFSSSEVTLTLNGTCSYYNITLPKGEYYLCIYNPTNSPALVYFCYRLYPQYVNPFLRFSVFQGGNYNYAPTGIASYGVSNTSPYEIKFSSLAGYFNISCILAYNSSQSLVKPCEVSLQLNAVLVVCNENNETQIYWPQDVIWLYTNDSIVVYHDNVLNFTNPIATLTNSSITSQNGYVSPSNNNNGIIQYYYGNYKYAPYFAYNLPFSGLLIMNESVVKGQGVLITMQVEVLQNGTSAVMQSETFDKILIHDPYVKDAYFLVDGKEYTPAGIHGYLGSFYDAELILGGGACGEITTFEKLNAVLGLYYWNGDEYVTFPSYYTFGGDTAESTYNAHVTLENNGMVKVSVGTPDFTYLGKVSQQALKVSPYVPKTTSSQTTLPPSTTPSSTQPSSATSSSLILYIIPAMLIIIVAIIILAKRK
ncbi:thermopsin [Acidianus sp. HS-5]|uniref:thermopsin n=1 Tax=Acidianus sp. HS-5 TaxID=2886040 RepID=UPI001F1B7AEF|nr:thermopsin [Acidianus sp. HS-5]BDC18588.1 hypothetical protein HS5_14780 [Acidianus sp. HS-5]